MSEVTVSFTWLNSQKIKESQVLKDTKLYKWTSLIWILGFDGKTNLSILSLTILRQEVWSIISFHLAIHLHKKLCIINSNMNNIEKVPIFLFTYLWNPTSFIIIKLLKTTAEHKTSKTISKIIQ